MGIIKIALQDTGVADALLEYLSDNVDDITTAMSFDAAERIDRATVDQVTVQRVRIMSNGVVEVDYEFEWSFFSGCKDISGEP